MPKVSVIVPNYNHAPFLKQRIESILNQSFQDFELILLDDCSTDNSREIIDNYRNHPKVTRVVYNDQNSGSAFHQWKKGMELAHGEWVWIAESDDWAERSFLEEMMIAVEDDPHCVLGSSIPCYVFPDGRTWHKDVHEGNIVFRGDDFVRLGLLGSNSLSNVSALLVRCDTMRQIDFSTAENMRLCGDWLLYAMLCSKGNVVESGKTLSYFRQHGNNTSVEAENNGLPLIEGVKVLDYLTHTFDIPSKAYSRQWGRTWAKLEHRYHYEKPLRNEIRQNMENYPSILFWHNIYRIRLWLK